MRSVEREVSPEEVKKLETAREAIQKKNAEIRSAKIESEIGIILIKTLMKDTAKYPDDAPQKRYERVRKDKFFEMIDIIRKNEPSFTNEEIGSYLFNIYSTVLQHLGTTNLSPEDLKAAETIFKTLGHQAGETIEVPTEPQQETELTSDRKSGTSFEGANEQNAEDRSEAGGVFKLGQLNPTQELTDEDIRPYPPSVDQETSDFVESAFDRITAQTREPKSKPPQKDQNAA